MTLRNAFENLALDSTIAKLVDGSATSSSARKVKDGKFFIAGKAITLSGVVASTNRATLQLANPSTSGKIISIVGLTAYSTISQQLQFIEDATMAAAATALTPMNLNRASTVLAAAKASWSDVAPTGGAVWPNESRVTAAAPLNLSFPPILLPPGKSFCLFGGASEAQTLTANVYFIEDPL